MIDKATPDLFLAALSLRDFDGFAACLAPSARARMLRSRGPEMQSGREAIARRFEAWFARASEFESYWSAASLSAQEARGATCITP